MKAKVLQKFRDIKTGEIRKKDDIITVSKKRFDEINENGKKAKKGNLVEEFKEDEAAEAEQAAAEAEQAAAEAEQAAE